MANFLQEKQTNNNHKKKNGLRCPVQRARPHGGISQAFHQFISVGRKLPKFSKPSLTGRGSRSPRSEDNSPRSWLRGLASAGYGGEQHWELCDLQTAPAPYQDWLGSFKPAMLSFLGPESLSLQLVAKLWSHWQLRSIYTHPVSSREPFLHNGFFVCVSLGNVPSCVYS